MYSPDPIIARFNLLPHLRVLFKCLNFFGLTGTVFDQSTQKFKRPKRKRKIANYVYTIIQTLSVVQASFIIVKCLGWCTATQVQLKSVEAQDEIIADFARYIRTVSAMIYASSYFRTRRHLIGLFRAVLRIFKRLKARTGPELFFGPEMLGMLLTKGLIVLTALKQMLVIIIAMFALCFYVSLDFTVFPMLGILMTFSYVYVHLVLLCFYEKMNEYLQTFGSSMRQPELARCLRKFMSISHRIHTIKRKLKTFGNSVFMSTYIGLFHDIEFVYYIFKMFVYHKYFSDRKSDKMRIEFAWFPACMAYTFDMFLISRLSDMLHDANAKFEAIVLKLAEDTPSLQRDVEVLLMQDGISGLELVAFGQIKVNQQFTFDFLINNVLVFVLVFLQFFAAEKIYTEHFKEITITNYFL